MTTRPLGLFDQDTRYRKLETLGDPLVLLAKIVPWSIFREPLEAARGVSRDTRKGGRTPYDAVLMFKILVLRELYALSDEQVEYQIADRLSFQRFLGIDLSHAVPDYTAVWRFREKLKGGVMEELFERLSNRLPSQAQCIDLSQGLPVRTMALSVVRSLRMHATKATLGSLPAALSRS